MIEPDTITCLLANTSPILLDFDGPICSIFARYAAPTVAAHLRDAVAGEGVELPPDMQEEGDPLEVLRWAATLGRPELTQKIDDQLRSAEATAASSAMPTPYAREVIVAATQGGRGIAIVSNNSAVAIDLYLRQHRLVGNVHSIFGRPYANPERMKPNPELLLEAAQAFAVQPKQCLFVGDSVTDITGAHAVGMPVIGYANKPHKVDAFRQAGADEIVTTMADIATALLETSGDFGGSTT